MTSRKRTAVPGAREREEDVKALETALLRRVSNPAPDGPAPPPAGLEGLEERVMARVRKEVLARFLELEQMVEQSLRTLAETDVRIIRELRTLRESDHPRRPGPM